MLVYRLCLNDVAFDKDIFLIPCRLSFLCTLHTALASIMVNTETCGGVGYTSPGCRSLEAVGQEYLVQTSVLSRVAGYFAFSCFILAIFVFGKLALAVFS
jgi:hypothetical protein